MDAIVVQRTITVQLCDKDDFDSSIKLYPCDRIYFGEYAYRVDMDGPQHPHPAHDPIAHWLVSDIMRTSGMYWKRERKSRNRRSIYLGSYDDVKWLCNFAPVGVSRVLGPMSHEHVGILNDDDVILRSALFYGKFDFRTELTFFNHVGAERKTIINEIMKFVSANFDDYRWGHSTSHWFYNYLYCKEKEYNELKGFINISFGNYIREEKSVKLLSQLL